MKIIRVEKCKECPYHFWQIYYREHVCTKINAYTTVNGDTIPPDCPLEDAKEADDGR